MIVTDEMLIAYIGGKLSAPERAEVEAAVAADPSVAERLRRHREVGAMIQNAITSGGRKARPAAGDKSAAPIVSLADARRTREAPPPPPKAAVSAPTARKAVDPRWAALAAGVVLGVVIGMFAPRPTNDLLDGTLQARGVLAATLEQGLTEDQKAGATVTLLGAYRGKDGVWCRTFAGESRVSGIACRSGEGWRLVMTEVGAPIPSPVMASAVTALGLGAPVSAAAERKARSAAWR